MKELLCCQVFAVFLVLAGDDDLAVVDVQRELALLVAHRLDRCLDRRVANPVIPEIGEEMWRLESLFSTAGWSS